MRGWKVASHLGHAFLVIMCGLEHERVTGPGCQPSSFRESFDQKLDLVLPQLLIPLGFPKAPS